MSEYSEQQKQSDYQLLDQIEGMLRDGQAVVDMAPLIIATYMAQNEVYEAMNAYAQTYERIDMSVDDAFPVPRLKRYLNVMEALNILRLQHA